MTKVIGARSLSVYAQDVSATMEKTLRELALEVPAATRVFEKLHLDTGAAEARL